MHGAILEATGKVKLQVHWNNCAFVPRTHSFLRVIQAWALLTRLMISQEKGFKSVLVTKLGTPEYRAPDIYIDTPGSNVGGTGALLSHHFKD